MHCVLCIMLYRKYSNGGPVFYFPVCMSYFYTIQYIFYFFPYSLNPLQVHSKGSRATSGPPSGFSPAIFRVPEKPSKVSRIEPSTYIFRAEEWTHVQKKRCWTSARIKKWGLLGEETEKKVKRNWMYNFQRTRHRPRAVETETSSHRYSQGIDYAKDILTQQPPCVHIVIVYRWLYFLFYQLGAFDLIVLRSLIP